jgi:putative transposase
MEKIKDTGTDEEKLLHKIKTYSSELWNPENIIRTPIETNSWFKMNIGTNNCCKNKTKYTYDIDELEHVKYKCKAKIILPNNFQKKVLLSWMDSYIDMYNETLKVINSHLFRTKTQRKIINQCFQRMKEFNNIKYKQQLNEFNSSEQLDKYNRIIKENNAIKKGHKLTKNSKKSKRKKPKKKQLYRTPRFPINFQDIRTIFMKNKKDEIIANSGINDPLRNTKIQSHVLDNAIKDVCTAFKSAFTNLRNGNIKYFRIRYIKKTKPRKIIRFEQSAFGENMKTFCPTILGEIIKTNDGGNFSDVHNGGTLMYNCEQDRFTLFVPEKIKKEKSFSKKESIAYDPGVTTNLTGYSNNHIIEIAPKLRKTIGTIFGKIDAINNLPIRRKNEKKTQIHTITAEQKKKLVTKLNNKIHNMINDLHWKSIKYTTDNYDTILIGNLSTKSIVKKKPVNGLDKMTKRVAMVMRLYVFHMRLKYKCDVKGCKYKKVNEKHTSQMCSYCGNKKMDLGMNRTYHCEECKKTIERDINGARNIFLVGIQGKK